MRTVHHLLLLGALTLVVAFVVHRAEALPETLVVVNGRAAPGYFNDGDTIRVLAGPNRDARLRLAGFNTLESYGPVHRWGGWTFKELYVNAKMATLNARRGTWHCNFDPHDKDGYGRFLAHCPDLAEYHVRHGLAHIYSIGQPSPPHLIVAQREAIENRRGMWAKGVPAMILTSIHSVDERFRNKGNNYNRLISPLDGVSAEWNHNDRYKLCEVVCHPNRRLLPDSRRRVLNALRTARETRAVVKGYSDYYLGIYLDEYATMGRAPLIFSPNELARIEAKLRELKADSSLWQEEDAQGACMVHVPWQRRFRSKPACLKWDQAK